MNYFDYRGLFFAFANQLNNSIASFSLSDDDRVLPNQPGQVYPQLQVDTPSWRPDIIPGATGKKKLNGSVSILAPALKDDWGGQDQVLDDLEPEMVKLIAFLNYKNKALGGRIELGAVYAIKRFESDNLWGWALDFSIISNQEYCHEAAQENNFLLLSPQWTEGESDIEIEIDGFDYDQLWTDKNNIKESLAGLIDQINENTAAHNVKAQIFINSIALTHTIAGGQIGYSSPGGHIIKVYNSI